MLDPVKVAALHLARTSFIDDNNYLLSHFVDAIELNITAGSPEYAAWKEHADALNEALNEGSQLPEAPHAAPTAPRKKSKKNKTVTTASDNHSVTPAGASTFTPQAVLKDEREAVNIRIRADRKVEHDGGSTGSHVGPTRRKGKNAGRARDALVDKIVIEATEQDSAGKPVHRTWCVACFHHESHRNPLRSKRHAVQCSAFSSQFPDWHKAVTAELAEKSQLPTRVRKKKTGSSSHAASSELEIDSEEDILMVDGTTPSTPSASNAPAQPKIQTFMAPLKMTAPRQAAIDLAAFQLVICAAIPFAFIANPWFINLMSIASPGYVCPDRSHFFTRMIAEQLAAFMLALAAFLKGRQYLTLSLDGWSSRAHDEIYTFHTTLPSRRSFLTAGHVFNGLHVSGLLLSDVIKSLIFGKYGATAYSAVVGDNGSNVRNCRKQLSRNYPWILGIYDPCHNLNLFLKDLGTLFKAELSAVSATSNFFSHSNLGTAQLAAERKRQEIGKGLKTASDTRFGTTYHQAKSILRCMPALVESVTSGVIEFSAKAAARLTELYTEGVSNLSFQIQLKTMVKLLEPGANGITALEGQNVTCADVFYVWVTIAWQLERVLADRANSLTAYRSKVIEKFNSRFTMMMTATSHKLFLLSYALHPLYFLNGGLNLTMPILQDGEILDRSRYPALFRVLRECALAILVGEHVRIGQTKGRKVECERLVKQLLAWVYGARPFHQRSFFSKRDRVLEYWKQLATDTGADILARVAIIIFSVTPSEICDERTASLLGWIDAARRSSLLPENLIACAQLFQWYNFGLTEGSYTHMATANVKVSPTDFAANMTLSAPSITDLLNDTDVPPTQVDREALEESLFNAADPYDLDEVDRQDAELSRDVEYQSSVAEDPFVTHITRSSDRWAASEYVKLESAALAELILPTVPNKEKATVEAMAPDEEEEDFDINNLKF